MNRDLALYVHIPFCARKCHYCDFASYAGLGKLIAQYIDAIVAESTRSEALAEANHQRNSVDHHAPDSAHNGRTCSQRSTTVGPPVVPSSEPEPRVRSLYLGGGTPSILDLGQMALLMEAMPPFTAAAEVTIEANPATISIDYLRGLRRLGINRLSLGVQSFDDALLRRLGRTHTSDEAVASYEAARRAGFDNISTDLIYGLPDQDLAHWRATLERVIALRPEHLSLYPLTVEEHTVFGRLQRRGQLAVPSEDVQADMYQLAEDAIGAAGYNHYELSNWAAPGFEARHNLVYWHNEPYVGLGAAAHSYWNGARFANVAQVPDYLTAIADRKSPVAFCEQIGHTTEIAETLMLRLRLAEGIAFEDFSRRFGSRLEDDFSSTIVELVDLGLLARTEGRITLTSRGRLLGNEVFRRFLPVQGGNA